jgi:PAS domain S-box-containing protein
MSEQLKEKASQSKEHLWDLLDHLRDLAQGVRPDGSFLYVNPAWRATLGYRPEEIAGLSFFDIIHPESRTGCEQRFRRVLAGENLAQVELVLLARDDRAIAVQGNIHCCIENGQPVATLGIFQAVTERKPAPLPRPENASQQGETGVRESEERYRSLVEMAHDAILILEDERIRYCNPAGLALLGAASLEALLGKPIGPFFHPDDQERAAARRGRIRATARPVSPQPFLLRRLDSQLIDVESSGAPCLHQGRPAIQVIFRDITERKHAEEARRESEARYRAIFDNAVEGLFQTSPEGSFLKLNPALARIYGYESPEEVIAQFKDIGSQLYVDPNRRQEFIRLIEAQGTVKAFEFEIRRKNGSRAWVSESTRAVHDAAGSLLWYEGTVEDITERKNAEEALRQREASLRMSQQIAHIGSWDWDMTTQQVTCSDELYRIYGITPDQFDGSLAAAVAFIHPDDRARIQHHVNGMLAGAEPSAVEYRVAQAGGAVRDVWAKGEVIRDSSGKPQRMIGIVMDVTERKRAEEERRQLEAQILHAQKLESLGVLAGGIAHDFNNLLTAILGFASLARKQLPADDPVIPLLQEIERGGERAADLAQQMLAYSGRGKFVIRTIALDTLVREMSTFLQTVVSKKAILHLDLAPALIEGDITQIRQVVMNLITNASDALECQEGVIAVHTGARHCDRAALRSPYLPEELPEGAYAFIEVRDSGCGMSEETLPRIFDPFFTTKSTGRGLGLAAVLGIVRGHRGTLQVSSSSGQGTTFEVLIPLATATRADPLAGSGGEARSRQKGMILVVEDEESVRSLARRVLEQAGFQVQVACHGREGVAVFAQYQDKIRGVVLDLTMPHMDGLEVAQRLKALRPGVPILLMSGYNDQEIAKRLAEIGVAGFLQKPFRPSDLITRVCQMLAEQGTSDNPGVNRHTRASDQCRDI